MRSNGNYTQKPSIRQSSPRVVHTKSCSFAFCRSTNPKTRMSISNSSKTCWGRFFKIPKRQLWSWLIRLRAFIRCPTSSSWPCFYRNLCNWKLPLSCISLQLKKRWWTFTNMSFWKLRHVPWDTIISEWYEDFIDKIHVLWCSILALY